MAKKVKYPSIHNFSENFSNIEIHFLRISNIFGYWFEWGGDIFGNHLEVTDNPICDQIARETFSYLLRQSSEVIKGLESGDKLSKALVDAETKIHYGINKD